MSSLNEQLIEAAKNGYADEVETLLDKGANVNYTDAYGNTALIHSAFNQRQRVIKVLLRAGANVNTANNFGDTALIGAASDGHTGTVILLLDAGADVYATNKDGQTALTKALFNGSIDIANMIKKHIDAKKMTIEVVQINNYHKIPKLHPFDCPNCGTMFKCEARESQIVCPNIDCGICLFIRKFSSGLKTCVDVVDLFNHCKNWKGESK